MQNYSPALNSYRKRKSLDEFLFRNETKADSRNFSRVLKSLGKWEMDKKMNVLLRLL